MSTILIIMVVDMGTFFLAAMFTMAFNSDIMEPDMKTSLACRPEYKRWVNIVIKPFLVIWNIIVGVPVKYGGRVGVKLNKYLTTTDGCK